MKQKITLFTAILFISFICMSQDIIIKTNGDQIKAKVTEIDIETIKYKMFENINGPTYTMLKSDVFMITYENGTKDIFKKEEVKKEENKPVEIKKEDPKQEKPKTDESITIKRNKFYYQGKVVGKTGIKSILSTNGSPEILQICNKGYKNILVGNIFYYSGMSVFLIGLFSYASGNMGTLGLAWSGLGVATIQFPFYYTGRSQVKKSIIKYNNYLQTTSNFKCNFGITQNGLGFSLNF